MIYGNCDSDTIGGKLVYVVSVLDHLPSGLHAQCSTDPFLNLEVFFFFCHMANERKSHWDFMQVEKLLRRAKKDTELSALHFYRLTNKFC